MSINNLSPVNNLNISVLTVAKPYETAALRVAVDLNIFDAAGENPIDAIELANVTGADRLLIGE